LLQGVFKGGTAIIMAAVLACNNETGFVATGRGGLPRLRSAANGGLPRVLWLADSFAGLPSPAWNEADLGGKQEAWAALSKKWTASTDQVEKNFAKFGVWWRALPDVASGRLGGWANPLAWRRETLAGWFKDTLPAAAVEQVAFLRCDADMVRSIRGALRRHLATWATALAAATPPPDEPHSLLFCLLLQLF
jgi:hypothetical protein